MDTKSAGRALAVGVLAGIVGYILWQTQIGFDTKTDDITTILANSASGATAITIALTLIGVGLVVHAAGLLATIGTVPGSCESLGIFCIIASIAVWVTSIGFGVALIEMGERFVAASAAGDAATAGSIAIAGGFTNAASIGANSLGGLLAGIGWLSLGLAYKDSDVKGAISFLPLGWVAIAAGVILLFSTLILNNFVSVESGSQLGGLAFILITIWAVSRGLKMSQDG